MEPDVSIPESAGVLAELERILANGDFDGSPRSRAFLRFIVEETLAGRQEGLSQEAIASRVFHRREDFDPTVDPIVRIQAGRLRRSLERYYLLAGAGDPVRIELPRGAYVPALRLAASTKNQRPSEPAAALDGWPCVVVLPVEIAPADPDSDPLAARFRDQLVLEMGRYRDVRVVVAPDRERERSSSHEYELSARLSRDPGGCWVTSLLAERGTGTQVWAQAYREGPDVTDRFCDETARVVAARVASEHGVVAQRLWVAQRKTPPATATAYGAILRSYQFFFNRDTADFVPAVEALKAIVKAEPECSLAWVQLSRLYSANIAHEYLRLDTPVEEALAFAEQGVRLDPTSQRARGALAYAFLLRGELAASRAEAQRALDLNPDSLVYLESIGWVMTLAGDWEDGPALVRKAVARNPHRMPLAFHALWADNLRRRQLDAAYQVALQYPDVGFWRPLMRACCLGLLGRPSEGARELAELLVVKPDFARRGRTLIGRLIKLPDLLDRVVDGLARAGLVLG